MVPLLLFLILLTLLAIAGRRVAFPILLMLFGLVTVGAALWVFFAAIA